MPQKRRASAGLCLPYGYRSDTRDSRRLAGFTNHVNRLRARRSGIDREHDGAVGFTARRADHRNGHLRAGHSSDTRLPAVAVPLLAQNLTTLYISRYQQLTGETGHRGGARKRLAEAARLPEAPPEACADAVTLAASQRVSVRQKICGGISPPFAPCVDRETKTTAACVATLLSEPRNQGQIP